MMQIPLMLRLPHSDWSASERVTASPSFWNAGRIASAEALPVPVGSANQGRAGASRHTTEAGWSAGSARKGAKVPFRLGGRRPTVDRGQNNPDVPMPFIMSLADVVEEVDPRDAAFRAGCLQTQRDPGQLARRDDSSRGLVPGRPPPERIPFFWSDLWRVGRPVADGSSDGDVGPDEIDVPG